MLTHGSLFAGIGGFDLGFERAGIKTVWQVEIDPFCRKVLEKHWPNVQRFADIRECRDLPWCDVITGGFPCQDISNAGLRAGIDGERSGLWSEMFRVICEVRPRLVVVENVAALLGRGFGRVVGDLASCGYDAEWDCIPASAVGAPHRRDRVWIAAYTDGVRCGWRSTAPGRQARTLSQRSGGNGAEDVADADSGRCEQCNQSEWRIPKFDARGFPFSILKGLEGHERGVMALAEYRRSNSDPAGSGWWSVEPGMGRLANGVSGRVAPLKALGNSLVPQITEWIGRRIVEAVSQ